MPNVVFMTYMDGDRVDKICSHAPPDFHVSVHQQGLSESETTPLIRDADFLMLIPGRVPDGSLRAATRLKLIQLVSAGFEHMNLDLCRELGVPVANNGGTNSTDVAEHTLGLILALYRRIPEFDRAMRDDPVQAEEHDFGTTTFTISGKTAGVIGFGNIGRKVARLLRAFGAEVVYADAYAASPEVEAEVGATRAPLDELLRRSDIVTLHTPLNDDTRGMIDARALGLMKRSAVLVNTCRGKVVVEADLVEALKSSAIRGAALDVLEQEPASPDHPLLTLDNVILTPHSAGMTYDTWERRGKFVFENMRRVWDGEAPLAVVS